LCLKISREAEGKKYTENEFLALAEWQLGKWSNKKKVQPSKESCTFKVVSGFVIF
jgi:hypothetical protein